MDLRICFVILNAVAVFNVWGSKINKIVLVPDVLSVYRFRIGLLQVCSF